MSVNSVNLGKRFKMIPIMREKDKKKMAFEKWIELGSLRKASDELYNLGYTTNRGSKILLASVRSYAHDYIVFEPDSARKKFQEYGEFEDTESGYKEWLWYLVNVAVKHPRLRSKDEFLRWALSIGIYKDAFEYFKTTFKLKDEDINVFNND